MTSPLQGIKNWWHRRQIRAMLKKRNSRYDVSFTDGEKAKLYAKRAKNRARRKTCDCDSGFTTKEGICPACKMPKSKRGVRRSRAVYAPASKAPRYAIQAHDWRFASYNMKSGPYLTNNMQFVYTWETHEGAEAQLPLYEKALGMKLRVVKI